MNADFVFDKSRLFLIAGPCAIERRDHALYMASEIKTVCDGLEIPFVYKSSFDKANRTSASGLRGVGMEDGLSILRDVRREVNVPTLTDVHETWQCEAVAEFVDVLQIPAFLSRQTDLLEAAAKTGCIVNIKKGQFMAPWDIENAVRKVAGTGNGNIIVTDRGTCFGYNTLISDMRAIPIMQRTKCPVVFDATHSTQQPSGQGGQSGGQREFVPVLAKSAVAAGCDGLFMEIHQDPDNAPSDGPCMLKLKDLKPLLETVLKIREAVSCSP